LEKGKSSGMINKNLRLTIYIYVVFIAFLLAFFYSFRPLRLEEYLVILTFGLMAIFFEKQAIVLPSGEDLSLISPILLTVGITNGFFPVLCVLLVLTTFMVIDDYKRWYVGVFNSAQYAFSALAGLSAFGMAKGIIGNINIENVGEYLFYIIVYFLSNVFFISLYLMLREGRKAFGIIKTLFEYKSVLIYFIMMLIGVLMSTLIHDKGWIVIPILGIILWGIGSTFRHYYKMFDHFRSLSIRDELTGLYNHRYFQEQLLTITESKHICSLLLMDLDYFKQYNDMYGHPEGDKLLKHFSNLLTAELGHIGTVCRYGGEEFTVILDGIDSYEALEIAESFRKTVSSMHFYGMEHMPDQVISVSIGVSTFPSQAGNKDELIMLADQALYRVKYTSRNKAALYSSVMDDLRGDFRLGTNETEIIHKVETFLTIINSKDHYTFGHTERVMEYAVGLASKLGLSEEDLRNIRYSALLHDIGKVEVPSDILTKKSRLSNEEWQIIKMHVTWGEQIVQPIKELHGCLPIIRHHHERYDGTGYPDHLAGRDIPIGARIMTIVDSFDAMTSERPYQKSKSIEAAIEELRTCAGSQFDPDFVEPFIEVISELRPEFIGRGA
jgi:diguanylate cyclase (GGDEF)-like protein/putative nucleotidyltransferase with HDIG domain